MLSISVVTKLDLVLSSHYKGQDLSENWRVGLNSRHHHLPLNHTASLRQPPFSIKIINKMIFIGCDFIQLIFLH